MLYIKRIYYPWNLQAERLLSIVVTRQKCHSEATDPVGMQERVNLNGSSTQAKKQKDQTYSMDRSTN